MWLICVCSNLRRVSTRINILKVWMMVNTIRNGGTPVDLPKSLVKYTFDAQEETTSITMPEWLAYKRGVDLK